jgi:syntaxin-binding protein 5
MCHFINLSGRDEILYVNEDKAVLVRSPKDMQIKDEIIIPSASDIRRESLNTKSDHEQEEKEISALCWVSSDGSMLAVGYLDGDIVLWNLPTEISIKDQKANKSSNNAVKLKLSSSDKRLPVIVLRWSNGPHSITGGQLFVYGGDDLGSEEALTVIKLHYTRRSSLIMFISNCVIALKGNQLCSSFYLRIFADHYELS